MIIFLYQQFQLLYDLMLKDIKNLDFVRDAISNFIDSSENNVPSYLFIFDDRSQKNFGSRDFGNFAFAGRQRKLRSNYMNHNGFHRSKLGRDIKHQTTFVVLFKPAGDVLHFARLKVHLGFGSVVVNW